MSNRIDRSLGVKPYHNVCSKPQPNKAKGGLKLTTVLKVMLAFVALTVMYQCGQPVCQPEVRCAD